MTHDQLTQDLAMISRNAIDYIIKLERDRHELLASLQEMLSIWEEDPAYGHDIAHKAQRLVARLKEEK
jgi:hypothetical protein